MDSSVARSRPIPVTRKHHKTTRLPIGEKRLRDLIESSAEGMWAAVGSGDKALMRQAHIAARDVGTAKPRLAALKLFKTYRDCFIDGSRLEPSKIRPRLVEVEPRTQWEDLFRVVRWTWSMPYSAGYGRRLRFIVWDEHHEAVIGIIGLQSPPADLGARDQLFQYPPGEKIDLINQTLDAYTIGSVPPYSNLLGGKLVAGLVASNEVRQAYWRSYARKKTYMKNQRIDQPLVAITTTSAFGRSSVYNRLRFQKKLIATSIGYTSGSGTVHLEALYPHMLAVVRKHDGDFEVGGYGNGPKRKWQHMKRALDLLGVDRRYFEHGIRREVFLYRLVDKLEQGMGGGSFGEAVDMTGSAFAQYWLDRWALPRSARDSIWRTVVAETYVRSKISGDAKNV